MVGQRIVNRLNTAVAEQLLIGAVPARNAQLGGSVTGLLRVARRDGGHFRHLAALHGGDYLLRRDARHAQNTPVHFSHMERVQFIPNANASVSMVTGLDPGGNLQCAAFCSEGTCSSLAFSGKFAPSGTGASICSLRYS